MKHRLQTLLKHKLQWLVLLTALLGVSQGVLASTTVTAGEVIYVDASDGWFSNDNYYPRIYVGSNVVGEASEYNSTKKYAITITETATGTLKLTRIKGESEHNEFKPGDRSSGKNIIKTGNGTAEWSSLRQFVEGEYVYMINSTSHDVMWVSSGYYAYLYIQGFSQTYCYKFELYSGTANTNGAIYRAQIKHSGVYSNFNVCRSTASDKDNTTSWPSNVSHQTSSISWDATKNCITGLNTYNTSDCTWSYYAPAPSSLTASVSGCSGGSGTEDSPYTIAVGDTYTITLTPSGTDSGLTYYYSFDNKSTSSTTATKSVTPGSSGTTQHSGIWVRSCAKDGSTYSSWVQSSPTSIWVQAVSSCTPPSAPTSVTASPSTICDGSSSTLSATVASGTLKWWDAETGGSQVSASVSPSTTTVYWAEADNGSCASSRVSVTVTVNALPTLSLGLSPSTVYPWDVATITATTTCTESTLVWKLYQGESLITTGAGSGSTYTFGKTSNTVYTLKGISSSGSGSSVTYTVKVDGNDGTCNAAQATQNVTISAAATESCGD